MSLLRHDKHALKAALLRALEATLSRMEASANETRQGAIHEESRPENDKDTRGLEASYLARGQAQRVAELTREVDRVRRMEIRTFEGDSPIALSALVTLERDDGELRHVFLAPAGGGVVLSDEPAIQAVTPETPLGRALIGKRSDDEVSLRIGGRAKTFVVVGLA
jgi:transcription elongation GreA/GreB family factor